MCGQKRIAKWLDWVNNVSEWEDGVQEVVTSQRLQVSLAMVRSLDLLCVISGHKSAVSNRMAWWQNTKFLVTSKESREGKAHLQYRVWDYWHDIVERLGIETDLEEWAAVLTHLKPSCIMVEAQKHEGSLGHGESFDIGELHAFRVWCLTRKMSGKVNSVFPCCLHWMIPLIEFWLCSFSFAYKTHQIL